MERGSRYSPPLPAAITKIVLPLLFFFSHWLAPLHPAITVIDVRWIGRGEFLHLTHTLRRTQAKMREQRNTKRDQNCRAVLSQHSICHCIRARPISIRVCCVVASLVPHKHSPLVCVASDRAAFGVCARARFTNEPTPSHTAPAKDNGDCEATRSRCRSFACFSFRANNATLCTVRDRA